MLLYNNYYVVTYVMILSPPAGAAVTCTGPLIITSYYHDRIRPSHIPPCSIIIIITLLLLPIVEHYLSHPVLLCLFLSWAGWLAGGVLFVSSSSHRLRNLLDRSLSLPLLQYISHQPPGSFPRFIEPGRSHTSHTFTASCAKRSERERKKG